MIFAFVLLVLVALVLLTLEIAFLIHVPRYLEDIATSLHLISKVNDVGSSMSVSDVKERVVHDFENSSTLE